MSSGRRCLRSWPIPTPLRWTPGRAQHCLLASRKTLKTLIMSRKVSLLRHPERQILIPKRMKVQVQFPGNGEDLRKRMMMGFLDLLFLLDLKSKRNHRKGPALPPGFKKPSGDAEEKRGNKSQASDDEEEENVFGPMPASGSVESNPGAEIEDRARRMKEKLLGVDDESKQAKRDSWMVDLPPELKNFGFGPRTFKRRANDNSGDRSIWTDTPADREKKAKEQQEGKKPISKDKEEAFPSERDKRLAEQISSYNDSQRSESLLDLHRKKLKSKTDGEKNKPQERRPFDRDQDLQVHQIDEARKKALIKRSRDLNTRFSHGKCNTFL
ncbi:GPALPP motifs-containing protein 1 isoform X3 [Thamnophis elegans]|uniref:GPALPP motifs-containing protein 1 isoform X3 n=1 Tax=Thamnophis elegans TaxID=35005 RepID=UPI0013774279|nr:GPALPP motifs-containing protein 1 isoform X3 [Thamnophis elegans]